MAMTFKQASIGEQHNTNRVQCKQQITCENEEKKTQRHCVIQNKEVIELAQSVSQPAYYLYTYLQHNTLNELCCVVLCCVVQQQ